MWSTPFEALIGVSILFLLLGHAAWGGLVIMGITVVFAAKFEAILEVYQSGMLRYNDQRMNIVGEVLNNIRIIKYCCWELKFMKKISEVRQAEVRVPCCCCSC